MSVNKQFEFADFIDEFKATFHMPEIITMPGYHDDDGEWVPPRTSENIVEKQGIVLPLTEDVLKYAENGVYTTKEKKLYVTFEIKEGTQITYKDVKYTVQSFKDYSEYADVFIYIMRWRGK